MTCYVISVTSLVSLLSATIITNIDSSAVAACLSSHNRRVQYFYKGCQLAFKDKNPCSSVRVGGPGGGQSQISERQRKILTLLMFKNKFMEKLPLTNSYGELNPGY